MTRVGHGLVAAEDLSTAWLETTKMVHAEDDHKAFHTITRIREPLVEDQAIRAACDALLAAKKLQTVDTVANTIFPYAQAHACASPAEFVERYLANYKQVRRFNANNKGTYFGRIVAHPGPDGTHDQLLPLIEKLRAETVTGSPMSARYEVRVSTQGDADATVSSGMDSAGDAAGAVGIDVPIYAPHKDNGRRGFPCLSMLSFQLENDRVHLFAQYRYEYLVAKGYGNYLGLAHLLEYISGEAGLAPGQMTIAAGRVQADASGRDLAHHLDEYWNDA